MCHARTTAAAPSKTHLDGDLTEDPRPSAAGVGCYDRPRTGANSTHGQVHPVGLPGGGVQLPDGLLAKLSSALPSFSHACHSCQFVGDPSVFFFFVACNSASL